ncbi:hypothetical protein ACU8YE_25040, partial [Ralstonia sp. VS2407]
TYEALARALSADPADRHQSAGELVDELEGAIALDPAAATRTPAFEQDRGALPTRPHHEDDPDDETRADIAASTVTPLPEPEPEPEAMHELVDVDELVTEQPAVTAPGRPRGLSQVQRRRRGAIAGALTVAVLSAGGAAALLGGGDQDPPPAAT